MQVYANILPLYLYLSHTHIYIFGYGVVLGLWFFSGFLGAFLGSCLKLRGSIVFSCKANVSQCGSDLHRYYAQKKNPHTCACHATLAAEHERSKSLCVSPTSTRSFGLQDLGPRRLRPRKACGASVAEARCCEKAAGTDAEREVTQFMETAADTTPDHKRMHTVQLWHEAPRNQCPFPCPASPLPARCRSTKNLGRHDRTQGTWCCSKASWRESPLTSSLPKSRGRRGGLGTLGTLIPFLKGSRGDPLRLPRGRSRPTPPKSLQPPPPPPSLKRLSLGKCLDKLLSHYLLSKVCFWTLLLPREGSRVTIPDCSILLSMPLCNTLKNIEVETKTPKESPTPPHPPPPLRGFPWGSA